MERKFKFSIGEYYHVYTRGVDRQSIFKDMFDQQRLLSHFYIGNDSKMTRFSQLGIVQRNSVFSLERTETLVEIGTYCFMPNHFHILVREKIEGGISKFMGKMLTGYSMYFNIKHKRSGPLFTKPFRAVHVENDTQLKYLFSYIHLNPLKLFDPRWKDRPMKDVSATKKFLEAYIYSSYLDYSGVTRSQRSILSTASFPIYFQNPADFEQELFSWLNPKDSP
jgi:putative transposase